MSDCGREGRDHAGVASSGPRLLAGENSNHDLLWALVRRLPDLDVVRAQDTSAIGADDPTLCRPKNDIRWEYHAVLDGDRVSVLTRERRAVTDVDAGRMYFSSSTGLRSSRSQAYSGVREEHRILTR